MKHRLDGNEKTWIRNLPDRIHRCAAEIFLEPLFAAVVAHGKQAAEIPYLCDQRGERACVAQCLPVKQVISNGVNDDRYLELLQQADLEWQSDAGRVLLLTHDEATAADHQKVRIVVEPFNVLLIEAQLVEVQKVGEAMIDEFDFGFDVRR